MEKKIPVKTLYLLSVISFGLIALGLGSTYAIFTATAEINNPISITSNLSYNSDVIETADVIVPAGETVTTTLNVTNNTTDTINYVTWYVSTNTQIYAAIDDTSAPPAGIVDSSNNITINVKLRNMSDAPTTVNVGVSSNTDSVIIGSNMKEVLNSQFPDNLIEWINYLYDNNEKTVVTRVSDKIDYNYTSNSSLLNDRLYGTTEDFDAGNIRYYGANPSNYIDIGDVDSEGNIVLWRIIGLIKDVELEDETTQDLIKLVRSDSIGEYKYSSTNNNWHTAELQVMLNSGTYYTELSDDVKNKIQKVKWDVSGDVIYDPWLGEIAIIDEYDYGYAQLNSNSGSSNNWLHDDNGMWILKPYGVLSNVYYVDATSGGLKGSGWVGFEKKVYPAIYLTSNINIESGIGTKKIPYVIG